MPGTSSSSRCAQFFVRYLAVNATYSDVMRDSYSGVPSIGGYLPNRRDADTPDTDRGEAAIRPSRHQPVGQTHLRVLRQREVTDSRYPSHICRWNYPEIMLQ